MQNSKSRPACRVQSLDHLVLTVADIAASGRFYETALGMRMLEFAPGRFALSFGALKINLHPKGREFSPFAARPTPGSADLCFLTDEPVAEVKARLEALGLRVEEGPVGRTGARNSLLSIYLRDPDGNLIEVANERPGA